MVYQDEIQLLAAMAKGKANEFSIIFRMNLLFRTFFTIFAPQNLAR
jgi:5-methylcytosine-specific restriction endonuclease McrBC regulatory subunit McrC